MSANGTNAATAAATGGMSTSVSTASLNPFTPLLPRIRPVREINITTAMINSLNNDPLFKHLDMTLDNYAEWSRSLIQICELNNISDYILGNIVEPAYDLDPDSPNTAYWAYEANNKKIVAFIKVNISELEKPFITTALAHEAWRAQGQAPGAWSDRPDFFDAGGVQCQFWSRGRRSA